MKYTIDEKLLLYSNEIKNELEVTSSYVATKKDILIVTHNQFDCLKNCLNSIRKNTEDYQIYIWDNASEGEMKDWIKDQKDCIVLRSELNLGFIIPNNELASISKNPYIILLNDDTFVMRNWDKALISQMQIKKHSQVGYCGGLLDKNFKGAAVAYGDQIDYIVGWCFAIPRVVYEELGLFDQDNLTFAYGEDSDLSMRIKESGKSIYALHLDLVSHLGNSTINSVHKNCKCDESFESNHRYLVERWLKQ